MNTSEIEYIKVYSLALGNSYTQLRPKGLSRIRPNA